MKFYSEVTNQVYDTEKDLIQAEKEVAAKNKEAELLKTQRAERAERAKAVENAYKKVEEAKKEADKILTEFLKDYGTYHTSIRSIEPTGSLLTPFIEDVFDLLLNNK